MGRRRRSPRRAERKPAAPRATHAERNAEKRRETFEAEQHRTLRRRNFFGILLLIPLAASFGCGRGGFLDALCVLPPEWWLVISSALFGSALGLTIRLALERRKFQRGAASERTAS